MENLMPDRLAALAFTVAIFVLAQKISKASKGHPLLAPALVAITVIVVTLKTSGISYQRYSEGAQFINFLLGPAVVALAIPLYRHLTKIRECWRVIGVSLSCGVAAGACCVAFASVVLKAGGPLAASLLTRSITAPVSTAIASSIGGIPALAAIFSVMAGVLGAAFGPAILQKLRIESPVARGLAMGGASHGQGTARILQDNEAAGAFAGLAMGIVAVSMAILLPLLMRL